MGVGQYLQIASAIVALAGISGLAVLRESLVQVREQNRDLRDEVADYVRRHDELEKTNTRQAADIEALRRVVTGEVHWLALGELLEHHHKLTEEHWSDTKKLLGDIRDHRELP